MGHIIDKDLLSYDIYKELLLVIYLLLVALQITLRHKAALYVLVHNLIHFTTLYILKALKKALRLINEVIDMLDAIRFDLVAGLLQIDIVQQLQFILYFLLLFGFVRFFFRLFYFWFLKLTNFLAIFVIAEVLVPKDAL
jgi:hypothetical protein